MKKKNGETGKPLREEPVISKKIGVTLEFWGAVTIFGLDCEGGKKDCSLRRAVYLVVQDVLFDLQEEHPLRYFLNQLLRDILWEELKMKEDWWGINNI